MPEDLKKKYSTKKKAKKAARKVVKKPSSNTADRSASTADKEPANTAAMSAAIEAETVSPAKDEPAKSFEENLNASIEEETGGAAKKAKKKPGSKKSAAMDEIRVEGLLDGVQHVVRDAAEIVKEAASTINFPDLNLPKINLPEPVAADINVESLSEGVIGMFKGTLVEDVISEITGTATDLVDKVTETISGVSGKLKNKNTA